MGMLSTLLIRNKDFKKYPGFFLAPLCQCEFGIFEVFLQLILTEIDKFRRRRVRFLLWGGGRISVSEAKRYVGDR